MWMLLLGLYIHALAIIPMMLPSTFLVGSVKEPFV